MWNTLTRKRIWGYIVAVAVMAATSAVLKLMGGHINPTTVALALLLIVLFMATAWGPKPAILASLLGVVSFNFFFLPPVHTFVIADPENWIALIAFLITAVTAGQLSAHARRRAAEADSARLQIEELYRELQDTFEQASQARALRESERLKSALLDAVTHDLRTPLTAIKASVTTLLDHQNSDFAVSAGTLGDDGRREMLEIIDEEADRLNQFIERMMGLARVEAGELQLRRRWTSIEEILLAGLRRAAKKTGGHRVDMQCDDDLPPVSVDEAALVEVFYILLDNAAKYSDKGTIIKLGAKITSDIGIEVFVEDEGIGIPEHLRQRVFDKFFRATSGHEQCRPDGMGMGLAIAKGIVEAHAGRIWIETGTSGGSRFVIALPCGPEAG